MCLSTACHKDDDGSDNPYGLPNATETGANTFGCLINGEAWVAEKGPDVISPTVYEFRMDYDEPNFGVNYNNIWNSTASYVVDSINEAMVFNGSNFTTITDLDINSNNLGISFFSNVKPYLIYRLDENQYYSLKITKLDTVENICSGLFECFLLSQNELDTLHITEGRFDKKYDPY
jgi:hypothetical protein